MVNLKKINFNKEMIEFWWSLPFLYIYVHIYKAALLLLIWYKKNDKESELDDESELDEELELDEE